MPREAQRTALPGSGAAVAGLLFAVDPAGLGGVSLRGRPGPVRDRWLARVRRLLPGGAPWHKVPVNVTDDRLLGGLDFAATIGSGRPVFATGLVEAADGGVLLLAMAERLAASSAATLGHVLDSGEILIERDGVTRRRQSRLGIVALDEGIEEEERISDALADRLAFTLRLDEVELAAMDFGGWKAADVAAARERMASIRADEPVVEALCATAAAFGIVSARGVLLALRAARAAAALAGRPSVGEAEAELAAKLVLPQRARCLPADAAEPDVPEEQADDDRPDDGEPQTPDAAPGTVPDDVVLEAVRAAIPPDLLARLAQPAGRSPRRSGGGRGGPLAKSRRRGRPIGVQPGDVSTGTRLNLLATLKAAAPWQRLRRPASPAPRSRRLELRREDLRITRYKERMETTTIFVVDASGSQAAQRLAEVKGAIELLLADCYVRRDEVALIAFRGKAAEVLLPPTRALARARRCLAGLPGGGGTPLALGIDLARELAESVTRQGKTPAMVLMTDGRANVSRGGEQDPARAEEDALAAGRLLRATGLRALLVDTARRPRPRARTLAETMGAHYIPLPQADAAAISSTVQRCVA